MVVIAFAKRDILRNRHIVILVIIHGKMNMFNKFYCSSRTSLNSCSASNDASKCTICDSNKKRTLVGGYCNCDPGWFDDGKHELCN